MLDVQRQVKLTGACFYGAGMVLAALDGFATFLTGQRYYLATLENRGFGAPEPVDPETVYDRPRLPPPATESRERGEEPWEPVPTLWRTPSGAAEILAGKADVVDGDTVRIHGGTVRPAEIDPPAVKTQRDRRINVSTGLTVFVDCFKDGKLLTTYDFFVSDTAEGPAVLSNDKPFRNEALSNLSTERLAYPPFDDVTTVIRTERL